MKLLPIATLILISSSTLHASSKSSVSLTKNGYSSSGGFNRVKPVEVKISKGFSNDPIPIEDRISALQQKLAFYELLKRHKLDPDKTITAAYSDKKLTDVVKELLPGIPMKFKGVDSNVTVKSISAAESKLEAICNYLDDAAGVYFSYSTEGITVADKP